MCAAEWITTTTTEHRRSVQVEPHTNTHTHTSEKLKHAAFVYTTSLPPFPCLLSLSSCHTYTLAIPLQHTQPCSTPPPPCLNYSPSLPALKAQGSSSRVGQSGTPYPSSPSMVSLKWLQEREVSLAPETSIEVGTAAVRQILCMGYIHTYTCTHETGQSSCSQGVEGVLCSRTAWEPVWSSMALLCSVLFWVTYFALKCKM